MTSTEGHPSPDDLALLALTGAPAEHDHLPGDERARLLAAQAHVAGCARCTAEVSDLARAVDLGRLGDLGELPPAPERVWQSISAELGLPADPPTGQPTPLTARPMTSPRRAGRSRLLLAVAAVVLLAAGVVIGVFTRGSGGQASTTPPTTSITTVTATVSVTPPTSGPGPVSAVATLKIVPGGPGTGSEHGSAHLITATSGPQLTVQASGLPTIAGNYEVWLFGPTGRMVDMGALSPDGPSSTGTFAVPHGIDPAQYATIDISVQQPDGNPAHSGKSVLRGKLV